METIYPLRNRRVPVIHASSNTIFFGDYPIPVPISAQHLAWFNELSGDRSAEHAIKELYARHDPGVDHKEYDAKALITHGLKSAALLDLHALPSLARWKGEGDSREKRAADPTSSAQTHAQLMYSDSDHVAIAQLIDLRAETPIAIVGYSPLAHQLREIAYRENWQVTTSELGAACVIFVSESHPDVCDHDTVLGTRRTHLHVATRHGSSVIGPLVTPGETSCLRCAYLHARDRDPNMPQRTIDWRNSQRFACTDSHISAMSAHFALLVVRAWMDGWDMGNTAWQASLPLGQFTSTPRPVHPLCGCMLGKPPMNLD